MSMIQIKGYKEVWIAKHSIPVGFYTAGGGGAGSGGGPLRSGSICSTELQFFGYVFSEKDALINKGFVSAYEDEKCLNLRLISLNEIKSVEIRSVIEGEEKTKASPTFLDSILMRDIQDISEQACADDLVYSTNNKSDFILSQLIDKIGKAEERYKKASK